MADWKRTGPVNQALSRNARTLFGAFQRSAAPDGRGTQWQFARPGAAFHALDTRFDR